jgi:membrane protease YdiL (CAAX protease family)
LPAAASYCGSCGKATRAHAREVATRGRVEQRRSLRAGLAFAVTCTATFVVLAAGSLLDDAGEWADALTSAAVVLVAGVAALAVLGEVRGTSPWNGPARWRWLAAAAPAAALTLAVSMGWVALLPGDGDLDAAEPSAALWVGAVFVAPLGEEWLCRGVAWRAAVTMAQPRAAWVLTSVLFAFLHALAGHLLAVPHRLFSGLVYGWLRWRSDSLWPGVLAHALHNALAVAWLGG